MIENINITTQNIIPKITKMRRYKDMGSIVRLYPIYDPYDFSVKTYRPKIYLGI
jgi:hypothetical protein